MFSKIRTAVLLSAALFASACATPEERVRIAPDGAPLVNLIELRDDYFAANPAEKRLVLKSGDGRGFSFDRTGGATYIADVAGVTAETRVIPGDGTRLCLEPASNGWRGACIQGVGTSVDGMRVYFRFGHDGYFANGGNFVQKNIVLIDGVPRPAR